MDEMIGKQTERLRSWEEMRRIVWQRGKSVDDLLAIDNEIAGRKFTVLVEEVPPYISLKNNGFSGYIADIWQIISVVLNVTTEFQKVNFATGRDLIKNGTVDILLTPVIITTTDIDEIDFSIPIVKNWYELFMKSSDDGASSMSYISTWSRNLWFAFIATIFILTLTLWSIVNLRLHIEDETKKKETVPRRERLGFWSRYYKTPNNRKAEDTLQNELIDASSFGTCFLFVLGSLANQGCNFRWDSLSMKAIVLVTLFFGLLMYNAYSSVLISRLAVGRTTLLFPTLESVAEAGTHTVCVRKHCYAYLHFKVNEDSDELLPKWQGLVNEGFCLNVTSTRDIAAALCMDNTVVLEAPNIIASIIEDHNRSHGCDVTRLYGHYARATASVLMKKNFRYRHHINRILFNLYGSGIMDYLHRKWLSRRIPDSMSARFSGVVQWDHIAGVIIVYLIAVTVSVTLLLVEILVAKQKEHRQTQRRLKEFRQFRSYYKR